MAQVLRLEKKRDYDAFLKDPKAWPLEVVRCSRKSPDERLLKRK